MSLVLNGHGDGNIAAEKQVAILEAARQLQYRPNVLALSLRSQRTRTIGVLTWSGSSGFSQDLLHAAGQIAASSGFLCILADSGEDLQHEERAATTLLDRQVDGFLVVAPELIEYRAAEAMIGTPVVLLNCVEPNARLTSVVPDERGAAVTATRLLLEQGHTRVAIVSGNLRTEQCRQRVEGVQVALRAAGLPAAGVFSTERNVDAGHEVVREALLSAERPTGLVCTHERLALGALLAAAELGLSVPSDLSLVSLEDGERLASRLTPSLATVQRPDRAMAEEAVALLVQQLTAEGEHDVRQLSFTCPASVGASVAPAPWPVKAPLGMP
ncbi:MAG: hypothetical protein JWP61_1106 [Friedmanniella sp.]|nr:hypothetical protein [Friedmanniella sp.]